MEANKGFSESRAVATSERLAQGDILERVDETSTAWNRHLLVITADCDLAHDKHQGRVTCIPLLTKEEYLLHLVVPKLKDKARTIISLTLQSSIEKIDTRRITPGRLQTWASEESTGKILTDLGIPIEKRELIGGMFDALRDLSNNEKSLQEAVETLVRSHLHLPNAKSEKNARSEIRGRLRAPFGQPPGDALFLSAISSNYDHGYFAYLRHLEQVWEPQISLGPTRRVHEYRRLARLQETYTYAIAQRFALVFMSIGLPGEYEDMRDIHAEILGEGV